MELGEKALETIGEYVKDHLEKWMREKSLTPTGGREPAADMERSVETAANAPGQSQPSGSGPGTNFPSMPETARSLPDTVLLERLIRLEEELKAQRQIMETRFDAVDKRFESVDKRFESVDKRFESVDKRFEDLIHQMDTRFEAVDRRFDDLVRYMDKRFSNMQWVMGLGFTLVAGLMAVFNFF